MPTESIANWTRASKPLSSSIISWTPAQGWAELPFEIREKIWLYTLEPRLIFLYPHGRIAQPIYHRVPHKKLSQPIYSRILNRPYDIFSPIVSLRFNHSTYNPKYTLTEHFSRYADFADTDGIGREETEWERQRMRTERPLEYKNSRAPPALYVCRESRKLAIKEGYVLTFKGVDKNLTGEDKVFWDRNHVGDTGIWVDFENDLIIFDGMYRTSVPSKCSPIQSLKLLTIFAPQEVRLMKRIALGSSFPGGFSVPWQARVIRQMANGNANTNANVQSDAGGRFTWNKDWKLLAGMGFQVLEEMWVNSSEPVNGTRSFKLMERQRREKVGTRTEEGDVGNGWINIIRKDRKEEGEYGLPECRYGLQMMKRTREEWISKMAIREILEG